MEYFQAITVFQHNAELLHCRAMQTSCEQLNARFRREQHPNRHCHVDIEILEGGSDAILNVAAIAKTISFLIKECIKLTFQFQRINMKEHKTFFLYKPI